MFLSLIVFIAKSIGWLSRLFRLGSGATWPGEVALALNPHIFALLVRGFQKGIILVAGTNGKTTTSLMITTILKTTGLRVVHNASGANLANGVVSACIGQTSWSGSINADWGVFEVDENTLPLIVTELKIQSSKLKTTSKNSKLIIILLNLFRDQLDRYGEVDVIAEKWQIALLKLDTGNQRIKTDQITLIANADDPLIATIAHDVKYVLGRSARLHYFGLDDVLQFMEKMEHATDSTFCPRCGARLTYKGIYYSHIGDWRCGKCKNKRPKPDISTWQYPLPGLYNRYNTLSAVAASRAVGVSDDNIRSALAKFTPAFGRQEEFVASGRIVKIFLSKNPAGFNEALRTIIGLGARHILLVLNDRIPDGRDVSWIWDVDFEMIADGRGYQRGSTQIMVSGDRCWDLALRMKYSQKSQIPNPKSPPASLREALRAGQANSKFKIQNFRVEPNLQVALETAIERTNMEETLYILPTYSAMLEVRRILLGKKIL